MSIIWKTIGIWQCHNIFFKKSCSCTGRCSGYRSGASCGRPVGPSNRQWGWCMGSPWPWWHWGSRLKRLSQLGWVPVWSPPQGSAHAPAGGPAWHPGSWAGSSWLITKTASGTSAMISWEEPVARNWRRTSTFCRTWMVGVGGGSWPWSSGQAAHIWLGWLSVQVEPIQLGSVGQVHHSDTSLPFTYPLSQGLCPLPTWHLPAAQCLLCLWRGVGYIPHSPVFRWHGHGGIWKLWWLPPV